MNNSKFHGSSTRARTKILQAYYGHPAKSLKLICITGSTGKAIVARYVHEILQSANIKSAVLASDGNIKASIIHKFLSDAKKNGANYAIITTPAEALADNAFYDLPIHVAALTNFIPSTLKSISAKNYLSAKTTLFKMRPNYIILNQDDRHFADFAKFHGVKDTYTYGVDEDATVRIDDFTLYKKGTEANLAIGFKNFSTATFVTGEPAVSYMACAACIASALKISTTIISTGIANYEE
ncbi:hypothetical protein IJI91_00670 [Candidatus Saccharibacteria bacterium]|nr:hypothetical protein [Candidatus Saccharibacteria bacterium]